MARITLVTCELNQGGTNRVLVHLANGFAQAGHDVDIVYCTTARALLDLNTILRPDIKVTSFGDTDWKRRGWGQFRVFTRYCQWLRTNRPDIVLATGNNISWFTALGVLMTKAAKRYYIKTTNPVIREQDSASITRIRRLVYGFIFRRSNGVLTLSDAETRMLSTQFPQAADRFSTVYNAYLTSQFDAHSPTARAPYGNRPLVVLGVGRLVQQKRFDRLIHAFAAGDPAHSGGVVAAAHGDRWRAHILADHLHRDGNDVRAARLAASPIQYDRGGLCQSGVVPIGLYHDGMGQPQAHAAR